MVKWKSTNNDNIEEGHTIQWLNEQVQLMIASKKAAVVATRHRSNLYTNTYYHKIADTVLFEWLYISLCYKVRKYYIAMQVEYICIAWKSI